MGEVEIIEQGDQKFLMIQMKIRGKWWAKRIRLFDTVSEAEQPVQEGGP